MTARHIPEGFHSVTPYLTVDSAENLIQFILKAFEANEVHRTLRPDGKIANAQLIVEGSMVEINDARTEAPALTAALHVFVPDVDLIYGKALAAGATALFAPVDMVWGERAAAVNHSGINWYLGTRTD